MKKLLLLALMAPAIGSYAQRVPLFEIFTSSTCPPCLHANMGYETILNGKPTTEYMSIKYQQAFPGQGDPYATAETEARRNYYGLNAIPWMMIDGGWNQNAFNFTTAIYDSSRQAAPEFSMTGAYTLDTLTRTVTALVHYTPLVASAATGAVLNVVIVERETDQNVKTNGETKFYNVVKKMLPDHNGTALPTMAVGSTHSTTLSFQFKGNYRLPINGKALNHINHATEHSVENFDSLMVISWIQKTGNSGAVYNGSNLIKQKSLGVENAIVNTLTDVNVFPNPAKNVVNVDFSVKNADKISALIIDLNGSVVASKSVDMKPGKNQISLNTESLASGYYNLVLVDTKTNSFTQKLAIFH